MASSRDAVSTGPQRAQVQETVVIRSRPNIRTGFSILLAGALIGGVIGITMRARQDATNATLAAQQAEFAQVAPPPALPTTRASPVVVSSPLPVQQPSGTPSLAYSGGPYPGSPVFILSNGAVIVPGNAKDGKDAKKATAATLTGGFAGKPAGSCNGGGGHIIVKVNPPSPSAKDKDDGYKVASANNSNEPKESAPAAREPKETRELPKESKSTSSNRGGKTPDDANALLKAAMGATENTL